MIRYPHSDTLTLPHATVTCWLGGYAAQVRRSAGRLAEGLRHWHQARRGRRQIEKLSDRMLGDVGLTRADFDPVSGKPALFPSDWELLVGPNREFRRRW